MRSEPLEVEPNLRNEPSRVLRNAILLIAILIPVFPVARVYYWQHALPRWYLAYAANELAAERVDSATRTLDRSIEMDPSIASDLHYWRLRLDLLLGQKELPDEKIEEFIAHAFEQLERIESLPLRAAVSDWIASRLLQERQAPAAVRIMSHFFPSIAERTPVQNNDLAYARAIARVNLDLASKEIDAALRKTNERNSGFLDTKAWVLHLQGKNQLAQEFSQAAIELLYRDLSAVNRNLADAFYPDAKIELIRDELEAEGLEKEKTKAAEGLKMLSAVTESQVDQQLRMIAVLRHHRASILEALGEEEGAALDRLWLRLFGFHDTESLI
ncbi:hypothetical protein VN12_09205 [Pirellula sp. SH-Sr6A]|uniref:hypothetical protein n=1 Tax=Pirellula sp. SH-Sr6A TaxID=1632865 RepID=UPI00078B880F|nr:hypothetical protein [Pirellula sp. SH-Sr6A]AMV32288.1 hypothetical protein VN12_09205 [Pirellula sp. SH-Sr6A]